MQWKKKSLLKYDVNCRLFSTWIYLVLHKIRGSWFPLYFEKNRLILKKDFIHYAFAMFTWRVSHGSIHSESVLEGRFSSCILQHYLFILEAVFHIMPMLKFYRESNMHTLYDVGSIFTSKIFRPYLTFFIPYHIKLSSPSLFDKILRAKR